MNINDVFDKSAFEMAKEEMCKLRTNESILNFYKVFANMVENHDLITAPANGSKLMINSIYDKRFVSIYSKFDNNFTPKNNQMQLDINIVIDIIRDNNFDGIVVDPGKDSFYITRKAIHDLTNRKDVDIF